jgi:hypothetical protein
MWTARSGNVVTKAPTARTSKQTGKGGMNCRRQVRSGTVGRTGLESFGVPNRLPLSQRSALTAKVALLEGRLFDGEGHRRHHLSDEQAGTLLSEINDLRHDLGWLGVDMRYQHTWPADIAS